MSVPEGPETIPDEAVRQIFEVDGDLPALEFGDGAQQISLLAPGALDDGLFLIGVKPGPGPDREFQISADEQKRDLRGIGAGVNVQLEITPARRVEKFRDHVV